MAHWKPWIFAFLFAGCSDVAEEACGDQLCAPGAYCDATAQACFCEPGSSGDPEDVCESHDDLCADAASRVGHRVCTHEVADAAAWNATSIPYATRSDVKRLSKYLVPSEPDSPLPATFSDTNFYRLHFCMLKDAFEPIFPGYRYADYNWDVYFRERRRMFAGSVYELHGENLPAPFAFLIETPDDADELLTEQEVYTVYRKLQDRFGVGELAYLPYTAAQEERAASWTEAPFAVVVAGDEVVSFEPYATGATYGRVRLYPTASVDEASGTFGAQDILVLETATNALEGVNAGVITGARQDILSHLNVLAAQRGTPNAFVADPLAAFAPFEGQLVRLDITDRTYTVAAATVAEAEAFWSEHRPVAAIERAPDRDFRGLPALAEVGTDSEIARAVAISRFGGKATGLATLYTLLDPQYQVPGFGIPVVHYFDFMEQNSWDVEIGGQKRTFSYAATLEAWLGDDAFRTDTMVRRARLDALTTHMEEHGVVDPELLADLGARIPEVFGDASVMVRFRSSSNAEDGVDFNGAGLYDSERVCVLDNAGAGEVSACDSDSKPKSAQAALRKVWASLWGFGAFEERQYFGLDQTRVAMGLLVSARFKDEQVDGVVFTGNPLDPEDDRITVNAQLGEEDVVSTTPGVTAELNRLRILSGKVAEIERVSESSLVAAGEHVLSDDQLRELGRVVAAAQAEYPLPSEANGTQRVLLDMEFKVDADGKLKIKQVRPFVPSAVDPNYATCELE